jgi:hypothetical protein
MNARTGFLLLISIVVLASVANVAATIFFWPRATSDERALQYCLCAANGCLFAQPSLIAVWWSSVSQPLIRRSYLCAGVFTTLFMSYVLTVNSVDTGSEIYLPFFFLAIAVGVVVLVSFSHWLMVTVLLGRRIASLGETADLQKTFELRRLFLATTVAAGLCAIYPFVFPPMQVNPALPIPWRSIIDFVLIIVISVTGISLLATLCTFINRSGLWLLTLLFLLLAPQLAFELLARYSSAAFGPVTISRTEIVLFIDTFLVAFFLTSVAVLFCFKSQGYQLQKK